MENKRLNVTIFTLAVLGCLVALNVLGVGWFGRLDLTRDKQFTLSDATLSTLRRLEDPVTVRAYFSKDIPPPFSTRARYVRDLLEEYYAHGGGDFRYEFIDPASEETEADKASKKETKQDIFGRQFREPTSIERELGELGIPPVQVRVNEDDKVEIKRAYMGLALSYRDQKEVIPVVQETEGLEYDLTTLLRKMTQERQPKLALVTSHGSLQPSEELTNLLGVLSQVAQVQPFDFATAALVPEDTDAVLVVGPKEAFSDDQQKALDAFVMQGGSAAFFLNTIEPNLKTLATEPANHGLGALLESYGVRVEPGLVLDTQCAMLNITQQRGHMRITQPVQYPFMPMSRGLDAQHPVTRGLQQVSMPFSSPLTVTVASASDGDANTDVSKSGGVTAEVLVQSSPESWVVQSPYNLDPMQRWTREQVGELKQRDMLVTLSGRLKSPFGVESSGEGRVLVAGGASMITDGFWSPAHEVLVLNLMDWLVLDEALLAVRSRGLAAAPLDEIADGTRAGLKYFNILGVPLGFVMLGLVRWRRREGRRARAAF